MKSWHCLIGFNEAASTTEGKHCAVMVRNAVIRVCNFKLVKQKNNGLRKYIPMANIIRGLWRQHQIALIAASGADIAINGSWKEIIALAFKSQAELLTRLTDNAVDFLNRAIDDFKDRPKYSIINFYTAVELFLKARLLHEHWSLIVIKGPDRKKFETGDFQSVSFDDACSRLDNIVQSPVPDGARKNFDAIRKHRNKMVHFFHENDNRSGSSMANVAGEQLRAWYDLQKLLTEHWAPIFVDHKEQFSVIERRLSGHREYLQARFDDLKPSIALEVKKGAKFGRCGSCRFKSARTSAILGSLFESECLVCRYRDKWFDYKCQACGVSSPLREGGEFACRKCGKIDDQEAIVDSINEFVATSDNYFDAQVPAHCSECEGYQSVAEYKQQFLCVVCFLVSDEVHSCGWCGDSGNGDMKDSNMIGCTMCEGNIGHQMSKDD